MTEIQYSTVMTTDVKVDIYAGDSFDQHEKEFVTYCEGDMSDETHKEDIVLKLSSLPVGARIIVEYPDCPECGTQIQEKHEMVDGIQTSTGHEKLCPCGFNWDDWAEGEFG